MAQEEQNLKRLFAGMFKAKNPNHAPVVENVLTAEEKEAERKRKLELLFSGTTRKHVTFCKNDEAE